MVASRFATRRAKFALLAVSVLLCVAIAEAGARLLWHRRLGTTGSRHFVENVLPTVLPALGE